MDTVDEQEEQVLIHLKEYKCSCCLDFMVEPYLSSCGHKFCESCIKSWLKQSATCPMCKGCLNDDYIFPDNYTKRKIAELKIKCPNAEWGCLAKMAPRELENHTKECLFESMKDGKLTCPLNNIGCNENIADKEALQTHLQQFSNVHFYMLMKDHLDLRNKYNDLAKLLDNTIKDYEAKFLAINQVHESQTEENADIRKTIEELKNEMETQIKALNEQYSKEDQKIVEILLKQEQFKQAMASL